MTNFTLKNKILKLLIMSLWHAINQGKYSMSIMWCENDFDKYDKNEELYFYCAGCDYLIKANILI